ncbi:hypothetical protein [Bounagaea algeriensis]
MRHEAGITSRRARATALSGSSTRTACLGSTAGSSTAGSSTASSSGAGNTGPAGSRCTCRTGCARGGRPAGTVLPTLLGALPGLPTAGGLALRGSTGAVARGRTRRLPFTGTGFGGTVRCTAGSLLLRARRPARLLPARRWWSRPALLGRSTALLAGLLRLLTGLLALRRLSRGLLALR